VSARALRPRATSAIAIAPATASDLTAPVVFGLESWQYRELLRSEGIEHARVGKRVIARVDDVVEALARIAARQRTVPPPESRVEVSDDEPTADALLARMGRSRTRRA
jgi:hypothetical protein